MQLTLMSFDVTSGVFMTGFFHMHYATVYRYRCGLSFFVMPTVHILWLSSKPIIYQPVMMYTLPIYYPEDGDNMHHCIIRVFQSCIHVRSGCRD